MELRSEKTGSELIVRLSGRLDAETTPAIRRQLEGTNFQEITKVSLDFSSVDYVSSAGLSLTLALAKLLKQAGGALVLTGLKGQVKQVLELSGLTRSVEIRESPPSGGPRTSVCPQTRKQGPDTIPRERQHAELIQPQQSVATEGSRNFAILGQTRTSVRPQALKNSPDTIQRERQTCVIFEPRQFDATEGSRKSGVVGQTRTIRLPASLDSIREFQHFVNDWAAKEGLPKERFGDLELILEEILVNVVVHAYKGKGGEAEVSCFPAGDTLCLQFVDSGPEFNPLLAREPDLNLPVEDRSIGGLGIHLVKQLSAGVKYTRENGANKLQIYVRK